MVFWKASVVRHGPWVVRGGVLDLYSLYNAQWGIWPNNLILKDLRDSLRLLYASNQFLS